MSTNERGGRDRQKHETPREIPPYPLLVVAIQTRHLGQRTIASSAPRGSEVFKCPGLRGQRPTRLGTKRLTKLGRIDADETPSTLAGVPT